MSQNPNSNRKLNTLLLKVSVQKESIEPRIVIKRLKLLLLCRICMQGNVPLQLGTDGGHVHHEIKGSMGPSQMDNWHELQKERNLYHSLHSPRCALGVARHFL